MKILIIRTGDALEPVAARRGQFAEWIRTTVEETRSATYDVVDPRVEPLGPPNGHHAVIITGSPAHVQDREPWMLHTEQWLRDVVKMGRPTFGICFGHQILAQALGGVVAKNPRGREIGTATVRLRISDDPIVMGLPSAFHAQVSHVDTVLQAPEGAESLAHSDLDDKHILRFSPSCYGVQFHPEFDSDIVRGYISTRHELLLSEGLDPHAIHDAVVEETSFARRVLHNFLDGVVR